MCIEKDISLRKIMRVSYTLQLLKTIAKAIPVFLVTQDPTYVLPARSQTSIDEYVHTK